MNDQYKSGSRLERVLRGGRFAITAELGPLDTSDQSAVLQQAIVLSEVCDAINVVDASGAHVHMSSVAACAILSHSGYEPVFQMSCRDRNRIALQGDLLGAAALGVKNVLCLTGDGVQVGDQPQAKPVFDFDSIQLIQTARIMRDEGVFLSGRRLNSPPRIFIGGVSNPFAPPYDMRPLRLLKKVESGADFIQTQYCFDVPLFTRFMQQVRDLGLHERVFILAGVGPLRSVGVARWMINNVPGVHIPEALIQRLEKTPAKRQREEGIKICVEIIQQVREIAGVHGVHIMAYRQEEMVTEIVRQAGLLRKRDKNNHLA